MPNDYGNFNGKTMRRILINRVWASLVSDKLHCGEGLLKIKTAS